jgi:hypothetical protein
MNNYQLASTNISLGGQMMWNLQIKGCKGGLCVSDFFLSPISKWIPYNRPDRDLLNYSHEENIKDLFDTISGDFFETKLDPIFSTKMPIITDNPETTNTYCDMYDAGVSRTSILKTGKSLQLFCPVWLEDFDSSKVITFRINMFTKIEGNNRGIEIVKDLKLNLENECDYHKRFVNYFNNYINNIVDNKVDNKVDDKVDDKARLIGDKLINIDFDNWYMSIEGVNAQNGQVTNKNISYVLPNLVSRFRPMMDTDDLIISNFANNNIICKQLFNFNFLFDIENLLSHDIFMQMKGEKLFFEVKCLIDGEELELKSFSYDYSEDFNIKDSNPLKKPLDFFEDYNSIQHMDKNKLSPKIIHWSSTLDNEYIFNIYPDAIWNTNPWGTQTDLDNSCMYWCNNDLMFNVEGKYEYNEDVKTGDALLSLIISLAAPKDGVSKYSEFKQLGGFTNNIYYNGFDDKITYEGYDGIKLYINIVSGLEDRGLKGITNVTEVKLLNTSDELITAYVYHRVNNVYHIIIDSNDIDAFSFANITKESNKGVNNWIENFKLHDFLNSNNNSKLVYIDNSMVVRSCNSPAGYENQTKEINYWKAKIPRYYLFRTDGHIKPTFVNMDNIKHYMIKKINEITYGMEWDKLVKTKFPALYPSIGYFFIEKIESNDYKFEKKWINNNYIFVVENNLIFDYEEDIEDKDSIKEYLIERLKIYYNIKDDDIAEYIYSLYNTNIYFDYLKDDSLKEYKYTIKMILK